LRVWLREDEIKGVREYILSNTMVCYFVILLFCRYISVYSEEDERITDFVYDNHPQPETQNFTLAICNEHLKTVRHIQHCCILRDAIYMAHGSTLEIYSIRNASLILLCEVSFAKTISMICPWNQTSVLLVVDHQHIFFANSTESHDLCTFSSGTHNIQNLKASPDYGYTVVTTNGPITKTLPHMYVFWVSYVEDGEHALYTTGTQLQLPGCECLDVNASYIAVGHGPASSWTLKGVKGADVAVGARVYRVWLEADAYDVSQRAPNISLVATFPSSTPFVVGKLTLDKSHFIGVTETELVLWKFGGLKTNKIYCRKFIDIGYNIIDIALNGIHLDKLTLLTDDKQSKLKYITYSFK
jgi:hypothetical protein